MGRTMQSGKSGRNHVASLAMHAVSAKHREGDDGVTNALTKVTAILYSISSKASNN